jgi:Abortive infection C-terminus
VHLGYLVHEPKSAGDRRPELRGTLWDSNEIQRYHDYRLSPTGREEAERIRRRQREIVTDETLGVHASHLTRAWMTEPQRQALVLPLTQLQGGLDGEHHAATVGAAKDLVEAACKVLIAHAGQAVPGDSSLPTLFKSAHALRPVGSNASSGDLARSLAATVQRLAELRNAAGSGHGRASAPELTAADARLAASASAAVAAYLIGDDR